MIFALTSGFLIGIMGSFHCMGMCGPIALALPIHHFNNYKKILYILVYNFGRVLTYAFLGALFGLIGKSLFIGKYQQIFSITIGVLILLGVLVPKIFEKLNIKQLSTYSTYIRKRLSALFKQEKSASVFFLIGIFNGLLPCGLVYFALASALISGGLWNSVGFMFMFGVATIPMMFAIAFFGNFISQKIRLQINKLVPYFIGIMAILLILRGLNLGIPYISPTLEQTETGTDAACCHQPEE